VCAVSSDAELGTAQAATRATKQALRPRFNRIWPVAGLGFATMVSVAWMGFLGFGFFKLIEFRIFLAHSQTAVRSCRGR
jgi:hypothetical protein